MWKWVSYGCGSRCIFGYACGSGCGLGVRVGVDVV